MMTKVRLLKSGMIYLFACPLGYCFIKLVHSFLILDLDEHDRKFLGYRKLL
jgi:hypothetical protein